MVKTIAISEEIHKELLKIRGEIQAQTDPLDELSKLCQVTENKFN